MELVRQLWRGEISLVRSYWLFGVLGSVLLRIPSTYWAVWGQPPSDAVGLGYAGIVVIYTFVALIGIWRSATKYYDNCIQAGSEHLKKKRIWATLAKVGVVLGFLTLINGIVQGLSWYDGRLDVSELRTVSIEINKDLPTVIDEVTVLTETYVDEASRLVYVYRVKGYSYKDKSLFDENVIKSINIRQWCDDADSKKFLQQGVTVKLSYIGDDNHELMGFQIDEHSCD